MEIDMKSRVHEKEDAHRLLKGIGLRIGTLLQCPDLDACIINVGLVPSTEPESAAMASDKRTRGIHIQAYGDRLPFLVSNSFDFVYSWYLLQKVCNPGRTLAEWLRITRPGGILHIGVPDKRHIFDRRRTPTPVQHLIDDYHENTSSIEHAHYVDYLVNTTGEDGRSFDPTDDFIERRYRRQESIHTHVFLPETLLGFLTQLQDYEHFELIGFREEEPNIWFTLAKTET